MTIGSERHGGPRGGRRAECGAPGSVVSVAISGIKPGDRVALWDGSRLISESVVTDVRGGDVSLRPLTLWERVDRWIKRLVAWLDRRNAP